AADRGPCGRRDRRHPRQARPARRSLHPRPGGREQGPAGAQPRHSRVLVDGADPGPGVGHGRRALGVRDGVHAAPTRRVQPPVTRRARAGGAPPTGRGREGGAVYPPTRSRIRARVLAPGLHRRAVRRRCGRRGAAGRVLGPLRAGSVPLGRVVRAWVQAGAEQKRWTVEIPSRRYFLLLSLLGASALLWVLVQIGLGAERWWVPSQFVARGLDALWQRGRLRQIGLAGGLL